MKMGEDFVPGHLDLGRPYLAWSIGEADKIKCRYFNASFVLSALKTSRVKGFISRGMWLYEYRGAGLELHIVLCATPDQERDGEISAAFFRNRIAIYAIGFNFVPGSVVGLPDPETILIVRMQGSLGMYAEIREATKTLNDVSPQLALMAAIDGVAQALGLSHVVSVSAVNSLSNRDPQALDPLLRAYDEFFLAHGGSSSSSDFFQFPVPFPKKPVSAVKPGHRLRTKKKQEMRAQITEAAHEAMKAVLDPEFVSRGDKAGLWQETWLARAKALWPWGTHQDAETLQLAQERRAQLRRFAALERRSNAAISGPSRLVQSVLNSRIKPLRRLAERYEVLRLQRLRFDEQFYLQWNGDVKGDFRRAALHFTRLGREARRRARFVLGAAEASGRG